MAGIRAGMLNRRVSIQQRGTGKDGYGGQSMAWTEIAQEWALIEALSGRELLAGGAMQTEISHLITIRWRQLYADLAADAKLRVVYAGRNFDINATMNEGEGNYMLQFAAKEGLTMQV